jgi:hypothetical protein
MGAKGSKTGQNLTVSSPATGAPAVAGQPLPDTNSLFSIMRLCGADMKKFEYMLFIAAQSCRLSYCDVGILHQSLKAYGMSPDVLNAVITKYDSMACPTIGVGMCKKRNALSRISGQFAPPQSYELSPCPGGFDNGGQQPIVRYISSPIDTTCIVINPSILAQNDNTIFKQGDCIVTFKGSSSIRNWEKNVRASAHGDFATAVKDVIPSFPPQISVSVSYVTPIVEIFDQIVEAMDKVCPGNTRIFVFGHSKGGAECELAGAMFVAKFPDKEVHIISLGAPKIISPTSQQTFNDQFLFGKNGKVTLTRVESTSQTNEGDLVTTVPVSMGHPGKTETPNTIDGLRNAYGYPSANNQRLDKTWPFTEPIDWYNPAKKAELDQKVASIVGMKGGDSNYIKVKGYTKVSLHLAPHMEYFGMYFWGSQRLAGMGNPAKTSNTGTRESKEGSNENKIFVSNIFPTCTKYEYRPWISRGTLTEGLKDVGNMASELGNTVTALKTYKANQKLQSASPEPAPPTAGRRKTRRKTRRKSKRYLKKTRRN